MNFLWLLVACAALSGSFSLAAPVQEFGGRENGFLCSVCKDAVELAEDIFGSTIITECLPEFIAFMCKELRIQDQTVCKGIVGNFQDVFLYVLNGILKDPVDACALLVSGCDTPNNPLFSNWTVPIPGDKPPWEQELPPNASGLSCRLFNLSPLQKGQYPTDLRVLQIADIHVDLEYEVGEEVRCNEPQCCRLPVNGVERATGEINEPAGYWGSVGNCDAPIWLFESMLNHVNKTQDRIDYVVVSGDLEPHADWEYSKDEHTTVINRITDLLHKYFPKTRVLFAVGNHEGVPINIIGPHTVPERFQASWLYKTMSDAFGDWLNEEETKTFLYNGCYSTKIVDGLRLISLNNVFGDNENFLMYLNQSDPDQTMSWLIRELKAAEDAGEKVQILAHIPGGNGEALARWSRVYYDVVNRFEGTIVAQFMGHTHSELTYLTFEDPNDSTSRPTSVIYSAPSITTYSDFNPAYRIYTIDGLRPATTFKIIDFEEYFLDLKTANSGGSGGIDAPWQSLYDSAKGEYQLRWLEPADWYQLALKFEKMDFLLQTYVGNKNRRHNTYCDSQCAKDVVCSIFASQRDTSGLCKDLRTEPTESKFEQRWTKEEAAAKKRELRERKVAAKNTKRNDGECPV